jgi:hypothetical protein
MVNQMDTGYLGYGGVFCCFFLGSFKLFTLIIGYLVGTREAFDELHTCFIFFYRVDTFMGKAPMFHYLKVFLIWILLFGWDNCVFFLYHLDLLFSSYMHVSIYISSIVELFI